MLGFLAMAAIYAAIMAVAKKRGHNSPLFGGSGIAVWLVLSFFLAGSIVASLVYALLSVAVVSGVVLALPARDLRSAPKRSATNYNSLATACFAAAGLALVAAVVLKFAVARTRAEYEATPAKPPRVQFVQEPGDDPFFGGQMRVVTETRPPLQRPDTDGLEQIGSGLFGVAMLALTGGFSCRRMAQMQAQPSATDVERADPRDPVLFLRSFKSDALRAKPRHGWLLVAQPAWMGASFDEFLAPALGRLGPFVGLGNPEDFLPTPGASKTYQNDANWQEVVLQYLRRSRLVLIVAGDTPGLTGSLRRSASFAHRKRSSS